MRIMGLFASTGLALSATMAAGSTFIPFDTKIYEMQESAVESVYNEDDAVLNAFENGCAVYYEKQYPWTKDLGGKRFSATVSANGFGKATCNSLTATLETTAKAKAFRKEFPLADTDISLETTRKEIDFGASLYVMGYEVNKISENVASELSLKGSPSLGIDEEETFKGSLGPIPVSIKYGVVGQITFNWQASADLMAADVQVYPTVESDVYVEGMIGSKAVLSAHAEGQMTLLEDELKGRIRLEIDTEKKTPEARVLAKIDNKMSALNGEIKGHVMLRDETAIDQDIFSWDGFNHSQSVLDENRIIPIQF